MTKLDLDAIEKRIDRIALGNVVPISARSTQQEPPPAAKPAAGWSFVPRRDENNLIVEVIATPIE